MNDPIKKENKKALMKFLPALLGFMLLGAVMGAVGAFMGAPVVSGAIRDAAVQLVSRTLIWWIPVLALALGLPCVLWLKKSRQLFSNWDGEEEESPELAERLLSQVLMLTSILLPAGMFTMSVLQADIAGTAVSMAVIVEFILLVAAVCVLQQKTVDLTRKFNPEKKGSVYDSRFHKKWLDSCDENERRQVGEAAYAAYRITGNTCLVLWVLAVAFDLGLAVSFAVMFIWGVMQVSYCLTSMKLSKRNTAVPEE